MRCKFSPFFNDVDPIKIVDIFRKMSFDCSPPMREEFIRKRYFWRFCPRIAILCVQYVKNPMVETGVFIDFWWILQIQMLVIFLKFQEFWCSLFLSRKYKCVHFCRICHDIAIFFLICDIILFGLISAILMGSISLKNGLEFASHSNTEFMKIWRRILRGCRVQRG